MKIGTLARRAGTNVETVRYYERIGLVAAPARTDGNYRDYSDADVTRLAFIRHARGLGFELVDVRALLGLADQPQRDCREVDEITSAHLQTVEAKISQLESLRGELKRMLSQCAGGHVADCRIMEALSDHHRCSADDHQPPDQQQTPSKVPNSTAA
jgi:Cu(I)-responsive transcriptional regulator